MKYFMAKFFVCKDNRDKGIHISSFRSNEQDELEGQQFNLSNDGWLNNSISFETLKMREGSNQP